MKKVMVLSLAFLFVMTPIMLAAEQSPAWKWARVQGEITSINSVDKQIVVDGVTVQVTDLTVIMMLQVPISFEDLAPAEPVEVPDWLLESKPSEGAVPAEPAPISESIVPPPAPEGLPDWLESGAPPSDVDPELMELFASAVPDEVPDETMFPT